MEDAWTFVCIVRRKKKIFDSRLDQPGGGEHKIKMSDIHGSPSCCVLRVVLPCGLILTPPKNDNNDDNNKRVRQVKLGVTRPPFNRPQNDCLTWNRMNESNGNSVVAAAAAAAVPASAPAAPAAPAALLTAAPGM